MPALILGPQMLVTVRYAALNPADAFLAQGLYPASPTLPHILGRDGEMSNSWIGGEYPRGDTVGILRCEIGGTCRELWQRKRSYPLKVRSHPHRLVSKKWPVLL